MKPKALYYKSLHYQPENVARMEELFDLIVLGNNRQSALDVLTPVQVLFSPNVNVVMMELCPKLKVIVSNTTDPQIDAEEAWRRDITICSLQDEPEFLDSITSTAEHTIGLMLSAWRRIPAAHKAACEGKWDRQPWAAPKMLSRMSLGLVGYGRLGRKVAYAASALGMVVDHSDPLIGGVPDLVTLAAKSDILSIHAPGDAPRNLVSREVLMAMPPGGMVINTARGELLDTDALIDFLESGHIAYAALDTVAGEYEANFASSRVVNYAMTHDNLILTPHIGGSTVDAWAETERFVIEKAARIIGQ